MCTLAARNASAADTGPWRPDPTFRGTWGIISTCLSTLVICVWSAIHVDIPPRHQKRSFVVKVRWLIIGLFAPDVLLYTALCQAFWGWELSRNMSAGLVAEQSAASRVTWQERLWRSIRWSAGSRLKAGIGRTLTGSSIRKNAWTLTHGYYAAMGGFILDSSSTPVFGTETRLVLSHNMMAIIVKNVPDLIPDIPEDRIRQQSKSNELAKALLVLQLVYFSTSCAARLAQELPLSLLEIWTLAHALGAIFVYVIWWKKPYDIPEPTLIMGDRAHEFAAYFQVIGLPTIPIVAGIHPFSGYAEKDYLRVAPCELLEDTGIIPDEEQMTVKLLPGESIQLEGYTFAIRAKEADPFGRRVFGTTHCPWYAQERDSDGSVSISRADILRWRLAARAAARISESWWPTDVVRYTKAGGLGASEGIPSAQALTILGIFATLLIAYALPHFLGWSAAFPTPVERMLWRVGSIVVGVFPITIYAILILMFLINGCSFLVEDVNYVLFGFFSLCFPFIALYIFANMFTLVESLRQLFHLPDGAFLLPEFSAYFPHFA
ncbi:uncharacterized protein PHACADRAFT_119896 [Phanerochaete carnosa HHB-10118-sp]|uniref:Uncharacterized protein n=1 Tax=Phanerochaete carnosa (strain HHB-10118-sp) TaxID=650164 RepID=K5WX03_PHACS|nr:uncharacterized protein PHACADRAFT_119896 [Phanerochaete carnosa HHB-10118-sp]EKM55007.1 hypothetical protein PHACADRAFT_119896 [Phanerochaete carnosa HHB-10118-sp]